MPRPYKLWQGLDFCGSLFNREAGEKNMTSQVRGHIESVCARWADALARITETEGRIEYMNRELSRLAREKQIFVEIVCNLAKDAAYPDIRRATMFDNEFLLYAEPGRQFSLRLFIWEPASYTNPHNHNSWGVIGPVTGEFEVINYRREDDGRKEGMARLVEIERMRLLPGETTFTLPLDDGIHKVGNGSAETIITLSVYGRPLPKGYIDEFDLASNRVHKVLSPQVRKKLLAIHALRDLGGSMREEALEHIRRDPLEIIRAAGSPGSVKSG
jgi:predicted metal-dependent enzyme (double-stranded beta helix superfamily)